jgi:hypothetical protein
LVAAKRARLGLLCRFLVANATQLEVVDLIDSGGLHSDAVIGISETAERIYHEWVGGPLGCRGCRANHFVIIFI